MMQQTTILKWNKYYPYVITLNCILLPLAGAGDPVIVGLSERNK